LCFNFAVIVVQRRYCAVLVSQFNLYYQFFW
jgi:hypothetical protein